MIIHDFVKDNTPTRKKTQVTKAGEEKPYREDLKNKRLFWRWRERRGKGENNFTVGMSTQKETYKTLVGEGGGRQIYIVFSSPTHISVPPGQWDTTRTKIKDLRAGAK